MSLCCDTEVPKEKAKAAPAKKGNTELSDDFITKMIYYNNGN